MRLLRLGVNIDRGNWQGFYLAHWFHCIKIIIVGAGLILSGSLAMALDIVRDGQATSAIVIPDHALSVVQYAAEELQYHVKESTGATLSIVTEGQQPPLVEGLIYLGDCQATKKAGIQTQNLASNGCYIKLIGTNLFIAGQDSEGTVIGATIRGQTYFMQHTNRTRVGTLLGVYEFLDKQIGVRWLWPGKLGEVIPKQLDIKVAQWNQTWEPKLEFSRLRDYSYVSGKEGWSSEQARENFLRDQCVWLRRQRFVQPYGTGYGHSALDYWERYGKTHPEYFSLLPDGTRRPDPLYHGGTPSLVSMCVSEPGLWKQIVEDWKNRSPDQHADEPWVNVCLNDVSEKCTCERCMAWDDSDVPYDTRLKLAREAFLKGDKHWEQQMGDTIGRRVKFFLAVQKEAEEFNPHAIVIGILTEGRAGKLNERVVINHQDDVGVLYYIPPGGWEADPKNSRMSPRQDEWKGFQWQAEQDKFRKRWADRSATGARLILRPNSFLHGYTMPLIFTRYFGECFSFAYQNGMVATDFDSLTGQWATQGPNLYALGRMHTRGEWPMEKVLDEYYHAFGPAEKTVREYFDYWESVTLGAIRNMYDLSNLAMKQGRGGPPGDPEPFQSHHFLRAADLIYTPSVMAKGRELLDKARQSARGDELAEQRVAFLDKGFKNAELSLAVQAAWRQFQAGGDFSKYRVALITLDAFRASVETENIANMGFLGWSEATEGWDRSILKVLPKEPGEPLTMNWKFHFDPDNKGEANGWFTDDFNDSQWSEIGVDSPWESQEVGRQWKQSHGTNYNGFAWYLTRFQAKSSQVPKKYNLVFGAVDEACKVWVNGKFLLNRPYPYQGDKDSWQKAFEVDISHVVRFDSPNTLAVLVEDNTGSGGIWKPVWLVSSD